MEPISNCEAEQILKGELLIRLLKLKKKINGRVETKHPWVCFSQ